MSKTRGDNKGFTLRELNSRVMNLLIVTFNTTQGTLGIMREHLVGKYLLVKAEHKDFLQNNMKG